MHRLRDSILTLLIHFAIFFNIERLDIGGKNIINIDSAIYVLTLLAVCLVISVRRLRMVRQPVLISFWTGMFFVVKLIFLFRRPIIGGVYTYHLFIELGLFIVAIFLAHNLALQLEDFKQAVTNFTFNNVSKIKPVSEALGEIQSEFYRGRRHQRPLSVLVIEQDQDKVQANMNRVLQNAQRAMMNQYVSVMLAQKLSEQLRRTDLLFKHDKEGRLVVLSPDTDLDKGMIMRNRILSFTNKLGIFVRLGIASFPEDAITFEQLLKQAEENLMGQENESIQIALMEKVEVD